MAHRLEDLHLSQPSLLTIGAFDGVHRGHQHLIRRLVAQAHAADQAAVVMTFFPHPDTVVRGQTGRYYLTTLAERVALIEALGVDYVVVHPFDADVMRMPAAEFVERLVRHLNLGGLWVGPDFALGYRRQGNGAFLTEAGKAHGFSVETVDLLAEQNAVISSSGIRALLARGDVAAANDMLGRAYSVAGVVIQGDQRGRTIGFPTANVDVWAEQMVPANGVYAGWATVGGTTHMAVTNVGLRPTFDGTRQTVEVHLLDFDGDLYGQTLRFAFAKHLRAERKFDGIAALVEQIQIDAAAGRAFLAGVEPG